MSRKKIIIIITLVVIVCIVVGFAVSKNRKKKYYDISYYNADTMNEQEPGDIYSSNNIKDRKAIQYTSIERLLEKEDEINKKAQTVIDLMEDIDNSSKGEELLNYEELEKKGYVFKKNGLSEIKQGYCKGEKYRIMPYDCIESDGYMLLFVRIAAERISRQGEWMLDYATSRVETYTIYDDGTFLPYAIAHIQPNARGIQKAMK